MWQQVLYPILCTQVNIQSKEQFHLNLFDFE
jgi:hypothetical protein